MSLRILQVASGIKGFGGQEKYIMAIAPALARQGHCVTLACRPGEEIERRANVAGLPVLHLEMCRPHDWRQLPRFVRPMRGRFDVVHIHSHFDFIVPAAAARLARVPVVVMTRHVPYSFRNRFTAYMCSELFYDGIIAVSEFAQRMLVEKGVNPKRIFLVKNGMDLEPWQSPDDGHLREELNIPPSAFLVAAAGRLNPEKGFSFLIRALAEARQRGRDAFCAIAGPGKSPELEELISQLGVESNVRLLGFRRDVPALFAAADVVVVSSTVETFSYAVLEGLASGRPVIACRVGAIPEIVGPETGYLVEPGDAKGIADAIVELAGDAGKRAAMGRAGRRRACAFSLDTCVQGVEAVYHALMRRKNHRSN